MMEKQKPIAIKADPSDDEDFDVTEEALELAQAERRARRGGRPKGSAKDPVTLRIDKDVLDRYRAGGPGWQSRINQDLRKAAGL